MKNSSDKLSPVPIKKNKVTKEGIIRKVGGRVKTKKERYAVLSDGKLSYYTLKVSSDYLLSLLKSY